MKKLAYGRKYQAEQREKLKELEELHGIEGQVIKIMRANIIGRCLFGIEFLPNSGVQKPLKGEIISRIPIIHTDITLPITSQKTEEATLKVVEGEDTLLLTGEHKGWDALGIEGLATAKGRNIIKSCGNFEKDLRVGVKRLKECGHQPPYDVLINELTKYTSIPTKLSETIHCIYQSPYLFTEEGKQDNMLVVKANQTNFVLLMGQDLSVCRLKNGGIKLWETLAPKICEPSAICEIQNIH